MAAKKKIPKTLGAALAELVAAQDELTDANGIPTPKLQKRAALLVADHDLKGFETELMAAMDEAQFRFFACRALRRKTVLGVGPNKREFNNLKKALTTADRCLRDQTVLNRLEVALAELPSAPKSNLYELFGDARRVESLRESASVLRGLAQLVELAAVDGRAAGTQRNFAVRAAVEPLIRFWQVVAGRTPTPTCIDSEYNATAHFLYDCLLYLDGSITLSTVVRLKK